jgi:adenine-specific DNA methylase
MPIFAMRVRALALTLAVARSQQPVNNAPMHTFIASLIVSALAIIAAGGVYSAWRYV